MKAMVVYDSAYGNTAQIARAIRDGINSSLESGGSTVLYKVGEITSSELCGVDILVVGSPTQGFRATSPTRDLIKRIPKNCLEGTCVAGFDTRIVDEQVKSNKVFSKMADVFGYAAEPISENLEKKGGKVVMQPAGYYVEGTEGPLSEGELERAEEWGRQIVLSISNR